MPVGQGPLQSVYLSRSLQVTGYEMALSDRVRQLLVSRALQPDPDEHTLQRCVRRCDVRRALVHVVQTARSVDTIAAQDGEACCQRRNHPPHNLVARRAAVPHPVSQRGRLRATCERVEPVLRPLAHILRYQPTLGAAQLSGRGAGQRGSQPTSRRRPDCDRRRCPTGEGTDRREPFLQHGQQVRVVGDAVGVEGGVVRRLSVLAPRARLRVLVRPRCSTVVGAAGCDMLVL